jgi:hypothetical protein
VKNPELSHNSYPRSYTTKSNPGASPFLLM